ncbi:MAG: hypothetical protein GQ564_22580 [Bacteroidales bacterium]|nr:hypothetical protein [Bacteroidales bacterium]
MKKISIIILLVCALFSTNNLKAQEDKLLKFQIKLNNDQIENFESIKLAYSDDICLGCPADSCVYCPIFSISSEELDNRIFVNALVKSGEFEYKLLVTDKEGLEYNLKKGILEADKNKEVINLKKIELNEIK